MVTIVLTTSNIIHFASEGIRYGCLPVETGETRHVMRFEHFPNYRGSRQFS
jgi:hypothetical protein